VTKILAGKKVAWGLVGVIGLLCAGGGVALKTALNYESAIGGVYESHLRGAVELAQANDALWRLRYQFPQFLVLGKEDQRKIIAEEPDLYEAVERKLSSYAADITSPDERQALAELQRSYRRYTAARPRWFELVAAGKPAEAAAYRARTTTPFGAETVGLMDRQIALQQSLAAKAVAELSESAAFLKRAIFGGLVVVLLGALALLVLGRRMVREMERRVEAESHLRIYEEVIRNTGEAVVIADGERRIIEVNAAYERATERTRNTAQGSKLYAPESGGHPQEFYDELWRQVDAEGHWSGELMDRKASGEVFPSWATINTVRNKEGKTTQYVSVSRDITMLKENEDQLQKLAFYDPLTSLPNRALFHDRLRVALANAERHRTRLAVAYIDLDRFKYVNDTLGHSMGDRLLIEIGQRILRSVREVDTVARMGGDEFTVLLTDLSAEGDAQNVCERIVEEVGKPVQLGQDTVYVGASVGIGFYPEDGRDASAIQKHADIAMYAAKEAGRGQVRVFKPEMLSRGNERLTLSVMIDTALKDGEFSLAYQPIIDLATGQPERVEALLRWNRPGGESIPPAKFIPHAEEIGLIKKIDAWVLRRACTDAQSWRASTGRDIKMCVNLSGVSLQQADMAHQLREILQATGFPAALLNVEITETAVIGNSNAAKAVLAQIAALGVGVSIDDFGTGYASLTYLTQFPINCIKLDRSFINRIGKDKASEAIIRALLELAAKLKLHVVAEGVEHASQREFLHDVGCDLMQGYLFARPMPSGALLEQMNSGLEWTTADGAAPEPITMAA
jgi:diguanylate cyclase (GGDEF)-like protein/PAS domain S-box-containing protein